MKNLTLIINGQEAGRFGTFEECGKTVEAMGWKDPYQIIEEINGERRVHEYFPIVIR